MPDRKGTPSGTWLVTGGAGYIGQHVVRALLATECDVVVLDNLSTGTAGLLPDAARLVVGDINERHDVERAFSTAAVAGVIHLAALKSARGSLSQPLDYWHTNVGGTAQVLAAMVRHSVRPIVFSSSCSVYGAAGGLGPIGEDEPTIPISPYGRSKLASEQVAMDAAAAHGISCIALRYFNVAGAGQPELGDRSDHNLIPLVIRAAMSGVAPVIYGDQHPTADGTCVRDYIDAQDLAQAHVLAAGLATRVGHRTSVFNVGTGRGHSVREVMTQVSLAAGVHLDPEVAPARAGDPPAAVAAAERFAEQTGWRPTNGLAEIVAGAWAAREASANVAGSLAH